MAKGKWVTGLAIAGAAYLGWRAFMVRESLNLLEYSIDTKGLALRFNGLSPELQFNLNVFNPGRVAVPVQSVAGQVFYKGQQVGSFQSTQPISIKGQERTTVALRARLQVLSVANLLLQKRPGSVVDIKGIVRTNAADLPLSFSYDLANTV